VAAQQQQIVPLISGTIKEVLVDIGDRVKKGQTVIVLDAPLMAKEWEQATSAFEMAQAEEQEAEARVVTAVAEVEAAEALRKVREGEKDAAAATQIERQRLWEGMQEQSRRQPGSVSRNDVESAKAKVEVAKAQIKAAEAAIAAAQADIKIKQGKLAHAKAASKAASAATRSAHAVREKARIQESFTQIKAAFDGVVTRRTADPGNFVQVSDSRLLTPLLTLQSTDRLHVVTQVLAQDAPFVGRGDPVDLTLGALPGVRLSAQKIARFSPTINASNRTMTVEIDVPNSDGRLMPGMYGSVTIHFKKRLTTALVVPQSCLLVGRPGEVPSYANAVYIVRDGKAYQTRVKVAAEDGKNAEIFEGVKESDLIVTNPKDLEGKVVPVEIKKEP
jgi:RND family efflux transporter MFP subunit